MVKCTICNKELSSDNDVTTHMRNRLYDTDGTMSCDGKTWYHVSFVHIS